MPAWAYEAMGTALSAELARSHQLLEATKAELDDIKQRGPYNQGWLDGSNAQASEQAHHEGRASKLEEAASRLTAALDQSARVAELEFDLSTAREASRLRQARLSKLEPAIDQARGLLELYEGLKMFAGTDLGIRTSIWLAQNPATATPAATGAEPECGKCKSLGPLAPCDGCYYGAEKEQGT